MNIIRKDIVDESINYFKEYAIDTITNRAIPSVIDGLKPVMRKVLYTAYDLKLNHKAQRRKVNTLAGSVLRFSVHGNASVEGAIANAGAWFKTNVPYIDGLGNYGSLDGSDCAASRYIEARLSAYSDEVMLGDIGPATTEWGKSYDDTLDEPILLPVKLPNILINGCPAGIAVGYAANHVSHNPHDVIDLCSAYVKNRNISIDEMIEIIKAPDFPTGGSINGLEGVIRGYKTGKGSVLVRGKYHTFEENGFTTIRITEVPYGITTAQLYVQIATLANSGKIKLKPRGLQDLTDLKGTKLDITIKKDENLDRVINVLYKDTDFETRIQMMNYVVTRDNKLKLATLDYLIKEFVQYREEVLWKKFKDELQNKESRIHVLDGLVIISSDMDNAIKLIRSSKGKQDAKEKLMKKYKLDDVQTEYIVTMAVYRLSSLEIQNVINEQKNLEKRCKELRIWTKTKSNIHLDKIMLEEWNELKTGLFKDYKRRTKISAVYKHISTEETIRQDPVTVIVTKEGYVKKFSGHLVNYTTDPKTLMITDDDEIYHIVRTYENKELVIITDRAKVFNVKVHTLDITNRRGKLLRNIVLATDTENIVSVWEKSDKEPDLLTISETGMLKRTNGNLLTVSGNSGKLIQQIKRNEKLASCCQVIDKNIVIVTAKGQILRLNSNIGNTGLGGIGVVGIKLRDEDKVVGIISTNNTVTLFTNDGYLKSLKVDDITAQSRGGLGLIGHNCNKEQRIVSIKDDKINRWVANVGVNNYYPEMFVGKIVNRTSKGNNIVKGTVNHVSDWR